MALTKEKNKRDRFLGFDMPMLSLVQGWEERCDYDVITCVRVRSIAGNVNNYIIQLKIWRVSLCIHGTWFICSVQSLAEFCFVVILFNLKAAVKEWSFR